MERLDLPRGAMGVQPKQVKGPCAAGIDIRPGSWDVVIGDVTASSIAAVNVVRPLFIGKVRDEADVLFLLRQYKVRYGVCDTRPETTLAKRLQTAARSHGIRMWRAEYNTAPSAKEIQENADEQMVKLDRTMTLDNVHYAFQTGLTMVLPQNFREITRGDFVREMCSSSRVPIKWMGRDAYSWENTGPDHAFHAFNYLFVAIRQGNMLASNTLPTIGAARGIVASTLNDNLIVKIETGTDGKPLKTEIDWEAIEKADEAEGIFFQ